MPKQLVSTRSVFYTKTRGSPEVLKTWQYTFQEATPPRTHPPAHMRVEM